MRKNGPSPESVLYSSSSQSWQTLRYFDVEAHRPEEEHDSLEYGDECCIFLSGLALGMGSDRGMSTFGKLTKGSSRFWRCRRVAWSA